MPQIHNLTFALLWIAIFSVCAASAHAGSYKQLYGFKGGLDGAQPLGRLIAVGRLLFGTTSQGGITPTQALYSQLTQRVVRKESFTHS
jgi:hypothetical protein